MAAAMRLFLLVALLVLVIAANTEQGYNGYKLYQITPKTQAHAQFLRKLPHNPSFDVFRSTKGLGHPSDVMVSPEFQNLLENLLKVNGLEYKVLVDDVQSSLDQQQAEELAIVKLSSGDDSLFSDYISYDEMNQYLYSLEEKYPDLVSTEVIGKSYEGRDLVLLHVGNNSELPTIFVDSLIHAREWITGTTALYLINQIVENPDEASMLENVNWDIIPCINPDGYEYSRSTTKNRFWRKTRNPTTVEGCIGVDENRNFGFHWTSDESGPCFEDYAGPEAFSEIEAVDIRNYFLTRAKNVQLYVNLHSYAQMFLYPWGYTEEPPEDADELQALGESAARAVEAASTIGTQYGVGTPPAILYEAPGITIDWVKGVAGVNLSYTIELPGAGSRGFNPPPSYILPVAKETFEGFRVFKNYIVKKFVNPK